MKQVINKIPFAKRLVISVKKAFFPKKDFTTSQDYWINRYKAGGNSGAGSYNNLAEFKGEVINDFVSENNVKTIIEFGCGDGNQLKYFKFPSYIGFDISNEVLGICKKEFAGDKTKQFLHIDEASNHRADLTMSLDVLYHLVEDETFDAYMIQLFDTADKYVIIYSCNFIDDDNYFPHVRPRKFTDWVDENRKDFTLLEMIPNKYPFVKGKGDTTSFADFYIYKKA